MVHTHTHGGDCCNHQGDDRHEHDDHDHHEKNHDYHIIELSPFPILTATALFITALGLILTLHDIHHAGRLLELGIVGIVFCVFVWWRKVINEGLKEHAHTGVVRRGLRLGMALFITSEVMFFFAFFLSYFRTFFSVIWFHNHIFDIDTLNFLPESLPWPPAGVKTFNPFDLPFLNTLILLLSGTTVTWAHHCLLHNNRKGLIQGLAFTVGLGCMFTCCQAFEYSHAAFALDTNNYSSNFFMATGFHGAHVIIGTIFLSVNLVRAIRGTITPEGHLGFEFAAWYWHFVDVVWLFLFVCIYWWGK
jgi:cytochrome c oxidase subunit III